MPKYVWEMVDCETERMKVHQGWLVYRVRDNGGSSESSFQVSTSMVFVPDAEHQWELPKET